MWVELDIFSGRPNPAWPLDAGEAQTVNALLAALPEPVPGPQSADEPLGYRGFHITDPALDRIVTVRGTTVVVRTAGAAGTAIDGQAHLEQALVEIAHARLDPDTYEFLLSQLKSDPTRRQTE